MSTFKGVMQGFQDIRVDYFRPAPGLSAPRACFLSHVHSDHLTGLESKHWRTSFIYCSPATREILLRLEKRVDRVGFESKVLEARRVQYGHLEKLLKPIPLETPTQIELKPGVKLQVTLFDANHCAGSVMFLFELDSLTVLYTGDIRSEPWHVTSLARNPLLLEYTSGLKTLDCIYLDTSRTDPSVFPSKADGLKELLQKVVEYPPDTVFHLAAWTYGYEDVWMALSKALKSQIHVNRYTYRIFQSLRGGIEDKRRPPTDLMVHEGPAFAGYVCGNTFQPGCLTTNPNVRLHSCGKGVKCPMLNSKTVWIQPIVRRGDDGTEVPEPAIVQAGNELSGRPQIEFDHDITIDQLMALFPHTTEAIDRDVRQLLVAALDSPGRFLYLGDLGLDDEQENISLPRLAEAILQSVTNKQQVEHQNSDALPRTVTFPYSRHSSYEELCSLLSIFKPRDVWPCTENPLEWHEANLSIKSLFGDYCSAAIFRYDTEMKKAVAESKAQYGSQQSQTTASSQHSVDPLLSSPPRREEIDVTAIESAPIHHSNNEEVHKFSPLFTSANNRLGSSIDWGLVSRCSPARKTVPEVFLRRNDQGKLRPFDEHGNEIASPHTHMPKNGLPGPSGRSRGSSHSLVSADPENSRPRVQVSTHQNNISDTAWNLRRREASGELPSGSVKRSRVAPDVPNSLVTETDSHHSVPMPRRGSFVDPAAVDGRSELPLDSHDYHSSDPYGYEGADTPGPQDESEGADDEPNTEPTTYYDPVDEVVRCRTCGYEVYGGVAAYYCVMGCGNDETPYFEEKEDGAMPQIARDRYSDDVVVDNEVVRIMVGDHLDYESSAYDTQDSGDAHFLEDYEDNSMIDDEEIPEPDSEEEPPSSNEIDWEARFTALQTEHNRLEKNFDALSAQHRELRRNLLGTDSDGDEDDDETDVDEQETAEDHLLVVGASAPDPVVTEIVLLQARAQSQESEISNGRIWKRAAAYEAAEAGGWHEVSLASVEGSHTHPELEL
ncbi:hypothetical protein QTJ16_003413 [Diplocarpon rosae]|uniref:DNA repair metallo-beta-lactamase domain-containing protein n=1 Tax=Diplocarpon rosae TaxID=946125 RepID=A0AAD9T1L7_9HELO|nr:hypothetical protein QTJ16_003413 [Diplocarpon rosae]